MEKVIAERRLMFARKGAQTRKQLVIRIGEPYWVEDGLAACPVEWEGLFDKTELADSRGMDLLQALHLAADTDTLLARLRHKYDFYWPSGEPYHDDDEAESSAGPATPRKKAKARAFRSKRDRSES